MRTKSVFDILLNTKVMILPTCHMFYSVWSLGSQKSSWIFRHWRKVRDKDILQWAQSRHWNLKCLCPLSNVTDYLFSCYIVKLIVTFSCTIITWWMQIKINHVTFNVDFRVSWWLHWIRIISDLWQNFWFISWCSNLSKCRRVQNIWIILSFWVTRNKLSVINYVLYVFCNSSL